MKSNNEKLKYDMGMLTRAFVQLMPAAILFMIIPSVNSVIDIFIASRYIGTDAVTAIGYYNPFNFILSGICSILAGGSIILMGRFLGSGKHKEANKLFSTDMIILEVIIVAISIISLLFATPLAKAFGAHEDMISSTALYLSGVAISFPATCGIAHLTSFLELEQRHLRNIVGVLTMLVLNITMDIFFVTVLKLGIFGLGLATSLSSWGYFVVQLQYYFTKKAMLRFSFKNFDASLIPQIILIGFPGAVTQIYLAVRGYMMNGMLNTYSGEVGIAALTTQSTLGAFTYAASYGISVATRTLFSVFVGSKDVNSLKMVMKIALNRIIPFSFLFCIIMTALSVPFTRIFYQDPTQEVYKLTVLLFLTNPFAMFLSGYGQIFSTYYQCHSWMKITNVISAVDGIIGMAVSMIILAPMLGALGVWISYITNGIIVILVIVVFTAIMIKKFPTSVDDFLLLPEGFGIEPQNRMNLSVHSIDDVINCSEKIMSFCIDKGCDSKKAHHAGLAIEEMAVNIVNKGFADGKKHSCVIEIAATEEELFLGIMDDGREFDPIERAKQADNADPLSCIGIRLVQGISKSMVYNRIIGLNILTIDL